MTVREMHYDFDLKIDKVAGLSKEDFNRAERDWLLNEAVNVLTKKKYGINNNQRSGFESNQKRISDLQSLHIKYPLQAGIQPSQVDTSENIFEISLDDLEYDYWFLTRAWTKIVKADCAVNSPLRQIQNDDLSYALDDPFNKSTDEGVIVNFGRSSDGTGESLYLYPDTGQSLGKVYIEYIKKPAKISFGGYEYIDGTTYPSQDCDLPEMVHTEIVDLAVQIASGIIENPQYVQLKTQKLFNNE